jgi:hypothetical protein
VKKLDFMVIGAQKCGTTALAQFLAEHPDIGMASPKEAHAFDHESYAGSWTDALLDEYYGGFFSHLDQESTLGEATPIYLFLPEVPAQLEAWNPNLKLVVILRDPVERAWSHYGMALANGLEHLPFWLALLVEPLRLWLGSNRLARHSALRENSYRGRGLYARQLRRFLRYFPRNQLLVIRSEDLGDAHDQTLARVFRFLGVREDVAVASERVNVGADNKLPRLAAAALRLSFWYDLWRLGGLVDFPVRGWMTGR